MKKKHRVFVSHLIKEVVAGKISVLTALSNYPKDYEDDNSLDACFLALTHFEADEDIRKKDSLYKEEQDNYLIFLAETLDKGEEIPTNIIQEYKIYYKNIPLYKDDTTNNVVRRLLEPINLDTNR